MGTSVLMTSHYYPSDLAAALQLRWPAGAPPLPELEVLTRFISVLYQGSLL